MGFIWFIAGFDDLSYEQKAEALEDVKKLLTDAEAIIERKVFEYAPIDRHGIASLAPKEVHDVPSLTQHFKTIKQSELSKQLASFVSFTIPSESAHKLGDPVDLAWAYYLHLLFRQIFPSKTPALHKTEKKEVRLAVDYNGWMLVKKVNLVSAQSKEVLAGLVGMHQTLLEKVPEFCYTQLALYKDAVEKTLSVFPERRSFARLPEILAALEKPELKTEDEALQAYALQKALARAGFPPYITTDLFSSLYPELKIPKPRGNFGGKKKK